MKKILPLLLIGIALLPRAFSQTPPKPPEADVIKITDIKLETASLPGSSLQWTKIVVQFTNTEKWADGIVFSVQAVLEEKGQYRLATGGVRYANVPSGSHSAVLYISPRAAARFGKPVAVQATCLFKDQEVAEASWKNPNASAPPNWQNLNRYPGILVNVLSTPWLVLDFEKSPDVVGNQ
jgi:hypothetical protein